MEEHDFPLNPYMIASDANANVTGDLVGTETSVKKRKTDDGRNGDSHK